VTPRTCHFSFVRANLFEADIHKQDDWDASEDEKPKATATGPAVPAKKKMSLKQKLAEKERLAAEGVSWSFRIPGRVIWLIRGSARNGRS
jgi:hypothetical protein